MNQTAGQLPQSGPLLVARRDPFRFNQLQRHLPEDLSSYVARKPKDQDNQYDKVLAYALSLVSGWSYADKNTVEKQLRFHGIDADVTLIACTNPAMLVVATAYFIRSRDGRLAILSFRGTEPMNLINWLTDANTVMRNFLYGKVHSGFYANVEVLWDDIIRTLHASVQPSGSEPGSSVEPLEALYITGHSLGAAMAVIATACLLHESQVPSDLPGGWNGLLRGVYTYGQPMVGDGEFTRNCAKLFRGRLFRHVFNDDLVPRMPPRTIRDFNRGFKHFGERRYSPSPRQPWEASPRSSTEEGAPSLLETLGSASMSFVMRRVGFPHVVDRILPLPYSLDDHMPTNYIQVSRSSL